MNCTDILTSDVMPIGGYYGPVASYTTDRYKGVTFTSEDFLQDKYFEMITECGLNLITTIDCDYADDPENFLKTMDLCEKHGIRIFVKDRALETLEGEEAILNRMAAYSHYKCFAGIRVIDEPDTTTFPWNTDAPKRELTFYCKVADKLNAIEGLLGYVNLFPYYAWMFKNEGKTFEDYENYVNTYSDGVPSLKLLSWDHYVFDLYQPRYDVYFQNMSFIREVAKKRGIPFWAFVQAGGKRCRNPETHELHYYTEGQHRWNVNTSLAMGAKGIQYYPLVEPHFCALDDDGKFIPNHEGLIAADGRDTIWYHWAKKSNAQIRAVDEYLMKAEHMGILPVGEVAKEHTANVACVLSESFRELSSVEAPKGALVGCFDYKGKTALYVVNYAQEESQEITLHFSKSCEFKTVCSEGSEEGTGTACTFTLNNGGAKLVLVE